MGMGRMMANWEAVTKFVLSQVPRILSQEDRDPDSSTYGCFDRNYWHFKIHDFSSAVLQQSALSLALLYALPLTGSPYYRSRRMAEWAVAAVSFWMKIQNRDGSFNEYYPYEHGYIPTSFSLYAVVETCRMLEFDRPEVQQACLRAARYLIEHEEVQALNQEAAAIPALFSTYLLVGEGWAKEGAAHKLRDLLARQSREGWFAEYGGADLGYLSTTLDFLMEYYRLSRDLPALKAAERIVQFSQYFIHQDGSVGGQYGSRNTEYFLLSGLSAISPYSPVAQQMLHKLRERVGTTDSYYASFDDRYLCHNMMHSLLRSIRNGCESETEGQPVIATYRALPCEERHEQYYSEAGLVSLNNGHYHLICGLKKGGIVRLFAGQREIFQDVGYRLKQYPGTVATTSWLNPDYQVDVSSGCYQVSGPFVAVKQQRISPWRHVLLRLAAWIMGRQLIPFLKKRLIFAGKKAPANFSRRVCIGEQEIEIEDRIWCERRISLISMADKFSLRHVASSKYYQPDELVDRERMSWNQVQRVHVHRRIDIATGHIVTTADAH